MPLKLCNYLQLTCMYWITALTELCIEFLEMATPYKTEMEPGHQVSDFDGVGSGHGSMCQTRCLSFNICVYRGVVSTE